MFRHAVAALAVCCAMSAVASPAAADGPLALRGMGSFHIGGRLIEITGQPVKEVTFTPGGVPAKVDPNGRYQVEQMYVQYFLPQTRRGKLPLLLWHGGGLSGVTYETKPDGGEGWLNDFVRKGWDVYISDAMERGRSGWTNTFKGDPIFLPFGDPWERFRIGPIGSWSDDAAKRATYPATQFPVDAYAQFMKQGVPRWLTTDDQIVAAYIELIDKVCPCVVLVHSQSGSFGFKAMEARPDKVKALVAIEPTLTGDKAKIASIKQNPVMIVIGDNAKDHPRWSKIRQGDLDYAEAFKAAGGSLDFVDLPDAGLKGNTHMMMMDKNSGAISAMIDEWLKKKGLAD